MRAWRNCRRVLIEHYVKAAPIKRPGIYEFRIVCYFVPRLFNFLIEIDVSANKFIYIRIIQFGV